MDTNNARNKGFTLLEVMISAGVLAVILTAALLVYISNMRYSKDTRTRDRAFAVLKQEAEDLMQAKYDKLASIAGGAGYYSIAFDGTGDNNGLKGQSVITNATSGILSVMPYTRDFFDPHGIKGSLFVYLSTVPGSNGNLMDAHIVLNYKLQHGVIGEDKNLNGVKDSGEDSDHNGRISSPLSLDISLANIGS